jgi:ABC-type lipoprotein release transport system permease subunit
MRLTPVPIDARDPFTFTVVALVLGSVAGFAILTPALRAAGLDPVRALRDE